MDFRNSKLIVALAIGFAIVVSTMAYFGFRSAAGNLFELSHSSEPADESYPRYERRYVRASRDATLRDDLRSIRRLRELVEAKQRLLEARTEELRRATDQRDLLREDLQKLHRQHDQLRRQSDQAMNILAELTSQADDEYTTTARQESEPAISDSAGEAELDVAIDLIDWQIEQANQRVAELELTALREIVRSNEATQALVATGAAAVPALVERLADDDPDVRQWAASVLGRIGPDAALAVEALLQMLNDQNEGVRESSRVALDQIENRS